jgi:hypothetical protein
MDMKRLGLIGLLGLTLAAAPVAAHAANGVGWRGGGHVVAQAPHVAPAPARRVYVAPTRTYVAPPRTYVAPATPRGYTTYPRYAPAHNRVWVPGYWGLSGGTRVWVGGAWTYPPFAGWAWVTPHWAWDGYQWVWVEGTWAPPAYTY